MLTAPCECILRDDIFPSFSSSYSFTRNAHLRLAGWLFVAGKLPAQDANASSFQGGHKIGSDVYRGIFWRILFYLFGQKGELYTLILFHFFFMIATHFTSTTRPGLFDMYCGLRGGLEYVGLWELMCEAERPRIPEIPTN